MDTVARLAPEAGPRHWQIGRFRFDPLARTLAADARSERISGKAARVLRLLAEHAGQVVSREQLIAAVWDGNVYTGETALTHTISQLRRSLRAPEQDGAPIETISKGGYRLLWPCTPALAPETQHRAAGGPRAWPWPWPAMAGMAMVLAALGLVAIGAWLSRHLPVAPTSHPAPAARPVTTLDGVEQWPTYSANGRLLAYVSRRTGGSSRLRVMDLQQPQATPREFSDPLGLIERPVWLGSDRLAYLQAEHGPHCRVMLLALGTGQARELAECVHLPGAAALAASPDGAWLAFTRASAQGGSGQRLQLHRLADGHERTLAEVPAGLGYGQIDWSHDGRHLAAMSLKDSVAGVVRLDVQTGQVTPLVEADRPIWALAWRPDDTAVVFAAGFEGEFALWQVPREGGPVRRFSRVENVTSLTSVPASAGGQGDMLASVRLFDDHIERHAPVATGGEPRLALRETIRSTSRDLYGKACADAAHPLFISFRGRRIGLWHRDGPQAEPRALPLPLDGTPDGAACSPDGKRYATAMTPLPGHAGNRLVLGRLDSAVPAAPEVIELPAMLSNPSWSEDGRSLLMLSADPQGRASLWRFDIATRGLTQIVGDQARHGQEVRREGRRWLYFSREGQRGLWRRPLGDDGRAGDPLEPVLEDLAPRDWGNWEWREGALWRISRGGETDRLLRRDASGRDEVMATWPAGLVSALRSLSVDASGQVLVGRRGPAQADLMRVSEVP